MLPEPSGPPASDDVSAEDHSASAAPRAAAGSMVWWLIGAIVVADQITKMLVQHYILLFDSIVVIPGLLNLVHIHNAGVAFGFLNDVEHPMRLVLTTGLALAALAGMVYYSRQLRPDERLARVGLSLIVGGALGNLIDRVRLGYVVDFVDVFWGGWHFWAFNVADAAITCGGVLLLFELFFPSRHVSHSV